MNSPHSFKPFDLSDDRAYQRWREQKLDGYPVTAAALLVPVTNPARLDTTEHAALLQRCCKANMAVYQVSSEVVAGRDDIRSLGRQFGLEQLDTNLRADEDSITSLRVVEETAGTHYIPYTNRPLNWHTDGYYNRLDEQVRGIILHCVTPAASGGDNLLLDPEIAYLLLRDENPDYVAALMQPDAMTIPPNVENGVQLRAQQSGPVFSVEKRSAALHMRYTARTRSIEWRDDRNTRLAAGFLAELLASDSAYIIRHRLEAGQGVICNNVLHRREAFENAAASGQQRLLYRARYHDRMAGTGLMNCLAGTGNALVE